MAKPNLKKNILINLLMALAILILTIYLTSIQFTISLIIILMPGFVLTKTLWKIGFLETAMVSIALGFTLIGTITYLLTLLHLPLNSISLSIILIPFSIVFLKIFYDDAKKFLETRRSLVSIILFLVLILGLMTRIYPIKDSYSLPFADSVVEGTVAKLIIDNQGIPSTWQPILPIELRHQPGLASIVAWIKILSQMEMTKIILLFSNLVFALLPLTIYLLVLKLLKNQAAAVTAAIITLVVSLPTATFIAGMNSTNTIYFLIPTSMILAIDSLNEMKMKKLLLLFLLFFGSLLIHPTFAFFFLLLFLPYAITQKPIKTFSKKILAVLVCLILSILAIIPYYNISSKRNLQEEWFIQNELMGKRFSPTFFIDPFFILFENPHGFWYVYAGEIPVNHLELYFFAFAFTAVFFYSLYLIIKTRNRIGYVLIIWYLLFLLFSSLQNYLQVHFPLWQYIYPTRVMFLIFLPVSILLSFPFSNLKIKSLKKLMEVDSALLLCLIILISYMPFGLFFITDYLTNASKMSPINKNVMEAMTWVGENVPKKSVILNFLAGTEAGAFIGDAGQWIPAVTDRIVIFPATSVTDDINNKQVKDRLEIMNFVNRNDTGTEFISLIKGYSASYIFVSKLQTVSRRTFNQVSPEIFKSNYYQLQFNNSDVSIFKINY